MLARLTLEVMSIYSRFDGRQRPAPSSPPPPLSPTPSPPPLCLSVSSAPISLLPIPLPIIINVKPILSKALDIKMTGDQNSTSLGSLANHPPPLSTATSSSSPSSVQNFSYIITNPPAASLPTNRREKDAKLYIISSSAR